MFAVLFSISRDCCALPDFSTTFVSVCGALPLLLGAHIESSGPLIFGVVGVFGDDRSTPAAGPRCPFAGAD